MDYKYLSHWIIGVIAALVWFWGEKVSIPPQAITLASVIVPSLMAHALGTQQAPSQPTELTKNENPVT